MHGRISDVLRSCIFVSFSIQFFHMYSSFFSFHSLVYFSVLSLILANTVRTQNNELTNAIFRFILQIWKKHIYLYWALANVHIKKILRIFVLLMRWRLRLLAHIFIYKVHDLSFLFFLYYKLLFSCWFEHVFLFGCFCCMFIIST